MIGGYAQGRPTASTTTATIGTNRDEFVVVRKLAKVDWLEATAYRHAVPSCARPSEREIAHENPRKSAWC